MNGFSEKIYLRLKMPTEDLSLSDHKRITLALQALGYENVTLPLHIIRKLYPMCREANFDITVTLVHRDYDWVVTDVQPGDTRKQHYGLTVDFGAMNSIRNRAEEIILRELIYGEDVA